MSGAKRDCTAIERLACGLAKLLLIDPDHPRFEELVVRPASELRRLVRTQLHALDPHGYSPDLQITRLDAAIREALGIDPGAHGPEVWAEVKKVPEDDRIAFVARLARAVDVSGSTASG